MVHRPAIVRGVLACVLGALATGVLLVLSMPLGEQAYLGWIAFAPLLVVTRGRGLLPGFFSALAAIFFAAWLSVTGVFYHFANPAGSAVSVFIVFAKFGFVVSLVVGIWADSSTKDLRAWWFASLAVLLEAVTLIQVPTHLALTQYRQGLILQVSSLGGIWLVSFFLWLANFWLASLEIKRLGAFAALFCGLSLAAGLIRPAAEGGLQRFAALQIANPGARSEGKMHLLASREGPEFVLWPEFGGIPFVTRGRTSALRNLSAQPGTAPVLTTFEDDFRPQPHNVASLFSKGQESAEYSKRMLFGSETQIHTAGKAAVAVPYSGGVVGLNICFDSCYPEIIRETARLPGVNVIAVPSSDPFAANYLISGMHAAYTPFRAAEEGIAFVKGDGMAYSQFVDSFGRIVAEASPGDRVLSGVLSVSTHWTVYKLLGDWFLWLAGTLFAAGLWRFSELGQRSSVSA